MPVTVDRDRKVQSGETERAVNNLQTQIEEVVNHLSGKPSKNEMISKLEAYDDLRIAGSQARQGNSAPSLDTFVSGGLRVLNFAGGSTDQEIEFEIQFPHAWKEKTGMIHPHVHWTPTTTGAGNVVWALEYSWANIGDVFSAPTTLKKGVATPGVAWQHTLTELDDIPANGKTFSSMMICRLYRNANDTANDTYADKAALLEFDIHVVFNSLGSYEELKSSK